MRKTNGIITKKRVAATAFALVVSLLFLLQTCSNGNKSEVKLHEPEINAFTPSSDGFTTYAENQNLILSVNETTAEFSVTNKKSGYVWYSQPQQPLEGDLTGEQIHRGRSMLSVSVVNKNSTSYEYILYNDCISNKQYEIIKLQNGVLFKFLLGIKEITTADIPTKINADKFNSKIISKLDASDKVRMKGIYRPSDIEDCVVFSTAVKLDIEFVYNTLEKIGYTQEDIDNDNREFSVKIDSGAETVYAEIKLEIDGNSLVVSIPTENLIRSKNYAIESINFCEFFGAAKKGAEGYFVVPDGDGGIIEFSEKQKTNKIYNSDIYCGDSSVIGSSVMAETGGVSLPMYGINTNGDAMIAVVEKGASLAKVVAEPLNYSSYYKIYYRLTPHKYDANTVSEQKMLLFSQKNYSEPYVIRYSFMGDADNGGVSYADMAKQTQKILYGEADKPVNNYSFDLDVICSINKRQNIFGISVNNELITTSYEQVVKMCDELEKLGVNELDLTVSGWLKKGLSHESALKGLELSNKLGGKKELEKMMSELREFGIEPYFSIGVKEINKKISNKYTAKNFLGQISPRYPLYLDINAVNKTYSPTFLINPLFLDRSIDNIQSVSKKADIKKLKFDDISKFNYSSGAGESFTDKEKESEITSNAVKKASQSFNSISVEGAAYFASKYADKITGLDVNGSRHPIFSRTIPFVPLVLNGHASYFYEPVNLSQHTGELRLKIAETGAGLSFKLAYCNQSVFKDTRYNTLYSVQYSLYRDKAASLYNEYSTRLAQVKNAKIIGHSQLTDEVFKTVFSNGYSVVTNYSNQEFKYKDITVPQNDYALVGGESDEA